MQLRLRQPGTLPKLAWACVALCCTARSSAAPLVIEDFSIDPIASGRAQVVGSSARFTYQPGGVVAHVNSGQATAELLWPLGKTLTQETSFELEAVYTIKSAGFYAKVNDFAQLTFGLLNSKTTGTSRTGGNAYDHVGVDYFPSTTTVPSWNVPALGPVTIQSDNGTSYFSRIQYPFGAESGIKAEGALPLDTQLTASLDYDSGAKIMTLTMSTSSGPLDVNSSGDLGEYGGWDGDIATIQLFLPLDVTFAVDRLAIPLWYVQAAGGGGGSILTADVLFDSLSVDLDALVPGDANGDTFVNGGDYTIWADHYLLSNQTVATGDFTGDGVVNGADYTVWADHYDGASASAESSWSAIPEPGSAVLTVIAVLLWSGLAIVARIRSRCREKQLACQPATERRRCPRHTRTIAVAGTRSSARGSI